MLNLYQELDAINERPKPFEFYTAEELWTDDYTSQVMLNYHLNGDVDISSRKFSFIDRSVSWMTSRFDVGEGAEVADFGCGPGLYAERLAKAGASVTGIDFSKRSIEYAKEKAREEGLDIRYVNQNYLNFESDEHFSLILMIMCDFCALSPEQRSMLIKRFYDLLAPDGAVLLDVYSISAFNRREELSVYEKNLLNGFWASRDYYGFLNTFKYEKEKVVLDKYTIIEDDRRRTVYNWLQYFSLEDLEKEFFEHGFQVESRYADVAGSPFETDKDEFAIVVRKR